jgi:hypothetical protein
MKKKLISKLPVQVLYFFIINILSAGQLIQAQFEPEPKPKPKPKSETETETETKSENKTNKKNKLANLPFIAFENVVTFMDMETFINLRSTNRSMGHSPLSESQPHEILFTRTPQFYMYNLLHIFRKILSDGFNRENKEVDPQFKEYLENFLKIAKEEGFIALKYFPAPNQISTDLSFAASYFKLLEILKEKKLLDPKPHLFVVDEFNGPKKYPKNGLLKTSNSNNHDRFYSCDDEYDSFDPYLSYKKLGFESPVLVLLPLYFEKILAQYKNKNARDRLLHPRDFWIEIYFKLFMKQLQTKK